MTVAECDTETLTLASTPKATMVDRNAHDQFHLISIAEKPSCYSNCFKSVNVLIFKSEVRLTVTLASSSSMAAVM